MRNNLLILNRPTSEGLAANIAVSVLSAVAMNALILALNPREMSPERTAEFGPPGYVIGIVWIGLFTAMAVARWLLLRRSAGTNKGYALVFLFLFCLAYPLYTAGLGSLWMGLIGNLATIACAAWVAGRIIEASRAAAGLVATIVVWVSFATVLVVEQLRAAA